MSNNIVKFLVKEEDSGKRLDLTISKKNRKLTRSVIKKLILSGKVYINDKVQNSPAKKIKIGDTIHFKVELANKSDLVPSNIKLNIIYEDNDLVIINKPSGLVVHPGAGNQNQTLVNGLIYKYKYLSNYNGDNRPGIVHRIDKDTSGLLVVAKNNFVHSELSKQFSNHTIKREYVALVWGVIRPLQGKIDTLISRSQNNRQLMSVSDVKGKRAVTNYETIKVFSSKYLPKLSFISFKLETGRTHQIRVHLKFKNTSLIGDKKYGKKNILFKKIDKNIENLIKNFKGQALHAKVLEFYHPIKKKNVSFSVNVPFEFQKLLDLLNKYNG